MRIQLIPSAALVRHRALPEIELPLSIFRDLGEVVIIERGDKLLATHVQNARWFRTDRAGAMLLARFVEHQAVTHEPMPCHADEARFIERVLSLDFFDHPIKMQEELPINVCISITERCNLECDYCFYAASFRNKEAFHKEQIPHAQLTCFLDELHTANPNARVYLTGGEPFAHPEVLSCMRQVKARGFFVGVVTNATLIREKDVRAMKELGVDDVRVSIDGAKKETHEATRPKTWNRVLRTLVLLQKYGLAVTLSPTLTSRNTDQLMGIAALARRFGFGLAYSPGVPTGRASHHPELATSYERMIEEVAQVENTYGFGFLDIEHMQGIRTTTCGLAGNSLYLGLDGRVAPCNMLHEQGLELGNAFEAGLAAVLAGETARRVRVTVDEIKHCADCHVRYVCGGPCRAASLFSTGSLRKRGPHCRLKYAEIIESMFRHAPVILLEANT